MKVLRRQIEYALQNNKAAPKLAEDIAYESVYYLAEAESEKGCRIHENILYSQLGTHDCCKIPASHVIISDASMYDAFSFSC